MEKKATDMTELIIGFILGGIFFGFFGSAIFYYRGRISAFKETLEELKESLEEFKESKKEVSK